MKKDWSNLADPYISIKEIYKILKNDDLDSFRNLRKLNRKEIELLKANIKRESNNFLFDLPISISLIAIGITLFQWVKSAGAPEPTENIFLLCIYIIHGLVYLIATVAIVPFFIITLKTLRESFLTRRLLYLIERFEIEEKYKWVKRQ